MTYTRLYPKLLECRSTGQVKMSKQIKARNERTVQQEKRLKLKIEAHNKTRHKKISTSSMVDAFLLKAASPK